LLAGERPREQEREVLSDRVRHPCDAAVEQARSAGRKTMVARDFNHG
jgi:histone H3/H4